MEHIFYNGFYLLIPMLFIRYFVLGRVSSNSLQRAAYEPPVKEKIAENIHHISINLLLILTFFLTIRLHTLLNFIGLGIYILGLFLYFLSTIDFGKPTNGLNTNGLFKISRNPMYVTFFINLLGCVMLTNSYLLLILLIIYQLAAHFVIKAEEKWCIKNFGDAYKNYMKKVRRYI